MKKTKKSTRARPPLRRQCAKCPWKKSTDPNTIPNGYCEKQHAALKNTIAEPESVAGVGGSLRMMACHETPIGDELPCIGWLAHQLGPGQNIALRVAVVMGRINGNIETVGLQHGCLEDTLAKEAS